MAGPEYGTGSLPVTVDPTYWYGRQFNPANALDPGTIMAQVQTQLQNYFTTAGFSQISIYPFPEYDLDTWWASGAPAFILLVYAGAHYSHPLATNTMVQERTLEYDIYLLVRQTAWAIFTGVGSPFVLVDMIDAAMTGFRPAGCRNGYFLDERFSEQERDGQIWLYKMSFHLPTMKVKLKSDYVLANAQQISLLFGNSGTAGSQAIMVGSNGFTLSAYTAVVAVTNASTKQVYLAGTDYLADSITGVVTLVANGSLTSGTVVNVVTMPVELVTEP